MPIEVRGMAGWLPQNFSPLAAARSAAVLSDGNVSGQQTGVWGLNESPGQSAADVALPDDLSRNVYCILGLPIDAVEMPEVLRRIDAAAANKTPLLISTVNVNFLATSAANAEFRQSLLLSDLCLVDGMPIVWIASLMGVPIKHRIAGSDMFDALEAPPGTRRPLRVFLFGGAEGVAAAAAKTLNDWPGGLHCVGSMYPGYGSVDDLSGDSIIDAINASDADLLVVALGAAKGQMWLLRNHRRLRPAVRTHLGAAINFAAGTIKRAPPILRKLGLEWLWRIKEEPHLWKRYGHDAATLLRLLVTRILPLVMSARWQRLGLGGKPPELHIDLIEDEVAVSLCLSGDATARYVGQAISCLNGALKTQKQLVVDLSATRLIDARFFGLLLMLSKHRILRNAGLKFIGVSPRLARLFRLHCVDFLLAGGCDG